MKTSQVKAILDDLGYNLNAYIPLKEINAIVLEGNMNLYPEPDSQLFFKSTSGCDLILCYRGKYDDDGNFVPNKKPYYAVPFDQILAFQLIGPARPSAAFRYGRSM